MEELRNTCKIFTKKSEGKNVLERPRHRWKGNIKMDLQKIGYEGVKKIHMVQDGIQTGYLSTT
jgi:hypothetical protein